MAWNLSIYALENNIPPTACSFTLFYKTMHYKISNKIGNNLDDCLFTHALYWTPTDLFVIHLEFVCVSVVVIAAFVHCRYHYTLALIHYNHSFKTNIISLNVCGLVSAIKWTKCKKQVSPRNTLHKISFKCIKIAGMVHVIIETVSWPS